MKINNILKNFLLLLFLIYIRYKWSTVSSWREDEATNIWLSYTKSSLDAPVGLLSSKMIPTPNGFILFGKIFTIFESLLHATIFLSLLQVASFYFLSKEISSNKNLNGSVFLILSFSTLMSSSSVEFWNNYILILFNSIFFIFLFKYLNSKKFEFLIGSVCLIIIPPSIYLAGITNSIMYTLLIFLAILITKNYKLTKNKFLYFSSLSIYLILNYIFIWRQYFKSISVNEVLGFSNLSLYDRINIFSDTVLHLPGTFLTIWTKPSSFKIYQIHSDINSDFTHLLFKLYVEFHKVIITLFCLVVFLGLRELIKNNNQTVDSLLLKKISLFLFFVIISILINPIIGGPNFINRERMENFIQFYPFFLFIWFSTPYIFIKLKVFKEKIIPLNIIVFSIFIILNILLSFNTVSDTVEYDGNTLTEADVPLNQKLLLIDFLANDIKQKTNNTKASISYDLGGGIWDWIPDHSEYFSTWYPDYPFTMGRVYDYQLYRKYLIINEYEGRNRRNFKDSDYIITYKFETHEVLNNTNYEHHYFGRLRLSKLINK